MGVNNEIKNTQEMMKKIASGEMFNSMVEAAIYQKAVGFTTEEVKIVENKDGIKEKITIIREEVPDLKAALTWLCNRCPEKWSENQVNQETLKKVATILQELDTIINEE